MKKLNLKKLVYDFKTKYPEGFTDTEIKALLKRCPQVNEDAFYKAMGVRTVNIKDGETVNFHDDVLTALRCVIENRDKNFLEWD